MGLTERALKKQYDKTQKKGAKKWAKLQKKYAKQGKEFPMIKIVFTCPNCGNKIVKDVIDAAKVYKETGDLSAYYSGQYESPTCPKCGVIMQSPNLRQVMDYTK